MTSTWSAVMSPSAQTRVHSGRWRSERARRTVRRACAFGSRHRVTSHAAALAAPSGCQFPDASKTAVALVTKASRRASWRWRISIDSVSAQADGSDPCNRSIASVRTSRSTRTVKHSGVTGHGRGCASTDRCHSRLRRLSITMSMVHRSIDCPSSTRGDPPMAACPLCKREMLAKVSCDTDPFIIDAKVYEPLPWGRERRIGRAPTNFVVPRLWHTPRRHPSPWL